VRHIVCTGSRGWQDRASIHDTLTTLAQPFAIVVGDAKGFDFHVWDIATKLRLPRLRFRADWRPGGVYDKSAGHKRNRRMLTYALAHDPRAYVLAGWDGSSTGTKGCIEDGKRLGMDAVFICYVPGLNGEERDG
jgi:hypothetical protein